VIVSPPDGNGRALGGCSTAAQSPPDAASSSVSWTLQQAELICAATWAEQSALTAFCVCGATSTIFDCQATIQTCDGAHFWFSPRPNTIVFSCMYDTSGALVAASLCSDAAPCKQFGPEIVPPQSCAAAQSACMSDGGAPG
jgi:hypothetical protein